MGSYEYHALIEIILKKSEFQLVRFGYVSEAWPLAPPWKLQCFVTLKSNTLNSLVSLENAFLLSGVI